MSRGWKGKRVRWQRMECAECLDRAMDDLLPLQKVVVRSVWSAPIEKGNLTMMNIMILT